MTRDEKKMIRLRIIKLLDSCNGCPYRQKVNSSINVCPNCPIGQQLQQYGKKLDQHEQHQNKRLFDGKERRSWTTEEEFYLIHHYGVVPVERIAKRLGRTKKAIKNKAFALKKGGKVRAAN
jgi:hypothetical protein